MSENQNQNQEQVAGEAKDKNFAELLKLAISHATFENKDIGSLVFGLLDSLASDQVYAEFEESDTTVSLMSDLLEAIQDEINDIAGRIEDDDETDKDEGAELEDDDDDDVPDELGEIDDEDDDAEIIPGAPGEQVTEKKDDSAT